MALDLSETIFLYQLIIILIIFLAKLYNVFRSGEWLSFKASIILFIVWFMIYGIGFITFLNAAESTAISLYASLFGIETALLLFNVFFFIFELFFMLKKTALTTIERPEQAYNSFEANKRKY